jgi:predicted alpha/beta-fold hydrolase
MFAIGLSFGGNMLTNLLGNLGEECYLDAAFIIHSAPRVWQIEEKLNSSMYGRHDKNFGKKMKSLYQKHIGTLQNHFKSLGIDL